MTITINERIDDYIGIIDTALNKLDFESEDNSWKNKRGIIKDLINNEDKSKAISSNSLDINFSDLLIIAHIKLGEEDVKSCSDLIAVEFENFISSLPNSGTKTLSLTILWITDNIESRIKLKNNKAISYTQEIKKRTKISKLKLKLKLSQIFYVDKQIPITEIKLTNIDRFEMTAVPSLKAKMNIQDQKDKVSSESLKGYVFTADLYNFAEIYNQAGDELFKKNVRLGIDDVLGVDKEIKNTLEKDPEKFWFRNNGITILLEEQSLKLDRTSEIILKPYGETKLKFSVINGAQTITAASEFFFGLDKEKEDDKYKEAKKAKVLLRIIQLSSNEEVSEISVALNRQKPIKPVDIAYTNAFVQTLYTYLLDSPKGYVIARRASDSFSGSYNISLEEFARARKAISGDPGKARSAGSAILLKIKDEKLSDNNIFVDKWYEANTKEELDQIYSHYYSPVFFALKIAQRYDTLRKKADTNTNETMSTIKNNGKWYFVAFLVFVLNGDNDKDYSNFSYKPDKFSDKDLCRLMIEFAGILNENIQDFNSNTFKKSDLYIKLKGSDYKATNFYHYLEKYFLASPIF